MTMSEKPRQYTRLEVLQGTLITILISILVPLLVTLFNPPQTQDFGPPPTCAVPTTQMVNGILVYHFKSCE